MIKLPTMVKLLKILKERRSLDALYNLKDHLKIMRIDIKHKNLGALEVGRRVAMNMVNKLIVNQKKRFRKNDKGGVEC